MQDKSVFQDRRERLLKVMGPGVAIVPAAPVTYRNADVENDYRQDSDFYYLTGLDEPGSALVLTNQHSEHRAVFFVRPRDPEREVWEGPRLGCEGAVTQLGADAAFAMDELPTRLPEYLADARRLFYRLGLYRDFDNRVLEALDAVRKRARDGVVAPREIIDPGLLLHEQRMRKSALELETLARAVEITARGHLAAMRAARPGSYEYQVEAELLRAFRAAGSRRFAYAPTVASGPNATILHYRSNDRLMMDGDLVLVDAAAEYDYLASDVTRTFPVNGAFTDEQRRVYELVLDAQRAAIEKVRPGATLLQMHEAAVEVITRGLVSLGLLPGPPEKAIAEHASKAFYMHRTSHWLGMDVHDVGDYFVDKQPRALQEGFVLTVEPGIYISTTARVEEKWKGIGVRIEDNLAVTRDGCRNLTADIPKEAAELERILRNR